MAKSYKTPGVYIEEIPKFPASIVPPETAVPVFIGYTQNDSYNEKSIVNIPVKVNSLVEFESIFGMARPQHIDVIVSSDLQTAEAVAVEPVQFNLHYAIRIYFGNGGSPCFICSCGIYSAVPGEEKCFNDQSEALYATDQEASITIIVLPDAMLCGKEDHYRLFRQALQQCAIMKNRMLIVDIYSAEKNDPFESIDDEFREKIGEQWLENGAAYYPYLQTAMLPYIEEQNQQIRLGETVYKLRLPDNETDLTHSLYHANPALYNSIKNKLDAHKIILAPSAAMAGIYCTMDHTRGIWKAPANVTLNGVEKLMLLINDEEQQSMNVHDTGKSVNAIRYFTGKGILVWGARTLAGNNNEWRYVPVKRFFNWVNQSIKISTENFVFEPNDANTWVKVKAMIENFLIDLWRQGALHGAKPEDAFFVKAGLNDSMNSTDIVEGRMIIWIGMAVVRPAEFINSRIIIKMRNDK